MRQFVDSVRQDCRLAVRTLCKSPAFTSIAVLTLALGIGATTAIFSMVGPLVAHPLPIGGLDRLVAIGIGQKGAVAPADYFDWKSSAQSFSALAAYREQAVSLTGEGVPERLAAAAVTPDFFDALKIQPAQGRVFRVGASAPAITGSPAAASAPAVVSSSAAENGSAGESALDDGRAAVLSYRFWQGRLGGDPDVLGRTVDFDGEPYTVVGVMPRAIDFPALTDVWIPLALDGGERARRDIAALRVIGRLRSSATVETAQAEMSGIARRLEAAYPATNAKRQAHVMPLAEFVQGSLLRAAVFLLLGLVAIVLLVVCVNIAGLQLARSAARGREVAVRAALGATRRRVAQTLFVESLGLAVAGGVAGILVAWSLLQMLLRTMPEAVARAIPGWNQIQLDGRALAFTAFVALGCAVAAGFLPAWRVSHRASNDALKEGARGAPNGAARHRLHGLLVIGQVAAALALVATAALFVRGFDRLLQSTMPYGPERVLLLSVDLPAARYAGSEEKDRFYRTALQRLEALPGVESAAALSTIPLSNNGTHWAPLAIEGHAAAPGLGTFAVLQRISPDYFDLLHIGMRSGRALNPDDRADTLPVAVVSETLAAKYWPGESALGKRIKAGGADAPWLLVVGVCEDVLYDWTDQVPEAVVYRPMAQAPADAAILAMRTGGNAAAYAASARAELGTVDPLLPAFNVTTLRGAIEESLAGNPQLIGMGSILGLLALVVAVIGVYSLVAQAVTARTHEFGVRMALGASPFAILAAVLRRGLGLTLAGIGAGIPLTMALIRISRGLFLGADAGGFALSIGVAGLLALVIVVACIVPAYRAAGVDPTAALRCE